MRLLPPPVAQRGVSTELDVDHALASLERLNEIAESMMRRLDELLMPAPLGHCASVRPTAQSAQSSVSVITHAQSERGEVAPGGVTGSTGLQGSGEASFRRAGLVSAGCDARADGVAPAACTKLWPRSAEDLGGARLAASRCSTKRPRTWNGAVGSASDLLPILFVTG